MHRDGKVCWAGFVLTTITVASVVTATILFTVFPKDFSRSVFNFDPRNSVLGEPDEKVDRFDHRSHSVPGGIYEEIDFKDDNKVFVQLDGSRSHTHYVEEGPPLVNGNIVNFVWFDNATHKVLALGVKPKIPFKVGTFVLGLTVADNTRDTQTDFTKVIVKSPIIPGVYCYFYNQDGLIEARGRESINFKSLADFPGKAQLTRCVFRTLVRTGTTFKFSQAGNLKFVLDGTELYNSGAPNPSPTYNGELKNVLAEVTYTRRDNNPRLQLTEGVGKMEYDVSKFKPVLKSIEPKSSTLDGGGKAKIQGVSLGNTEKVLFDGQEAFIHESEIEKDGSSMFVTVPKFAAPNDNVRVTVRNSNGESNPVFFLASTTGQPPIKFKDTTTLKRNGKDFKIDQITGIKYGPDHRYYVSTYSSRIYSFIVTEDLKVEGQICNSGVLGQNRIALGLAFNYASLSPRLYVSTSVLYWKKNGYLSGPFAWANGQIHVLERAGSGPCLKEAGNSPIVTGLPVSNYDHGVNGLVFDDDGNLHIQVGGSTNAGHNHADSALGGIDESPLSGASLIAYVNKPNFDGKVKYSVGNPGKAKQTAGFDVKVFMSGWRNSFGINIHSNEFLYATDNGASRPFGEMSKSCNTHGALPGGNSLKDKLGKVIKGKYFGHPNRNRGRADSRQCKFMAATERQTNHYQKPVTYLESSTNGVVEYTANTFDGQLKGNLILSKYAADKSPGKIFRVQLTANGDAKDEEELIREISGLSIEISPYGDLISPQLWNGYIVVLRPKTATAKQMKFISVMPPRGSYLGRNTVLVTGEKIGPNPVATFDGKPCSKVREATSKSFKCNVPAGTRGKHVKVAIVVDGKSTESHEGGDYKYMRI